MKSKRLSWKGWTVLVAASSVAIIVMVRLVEVPNTQQGDPSEITSEELEEALRGAVREDASEMVADLMGQGATVASGNPSGSPILDLAVRADAIAVISMLLENGHLDLDELRNEWLGIAVGGGSDRVAGLLVQLGADIDEPDAVGWRPLHKALLRRDHPDAPDYAHDLAVMLIDRGGRVDAATAAVGWTPLHLAADLNSPGIAKALIDAGAAVNPRTNLGGWTPLTVARRAGATSTAAVLSAAGGVSTRDNDLADIPVYVEGRLSRLGEDLETADFGPSTQSTHDAFYGFPPSGEYLGSSFHGAFTAPDATEQLVFEVIGFSRYGGIYSRMVSLLDEAGVSRGAFVTDGYIDFYGLCIDTKTMTHTAIFTRAYGGSCCGYIDLVYMHYDTDADTLTEAFNDRDRTSLEDSGRDLQHAPVARLGGASHAGASLEEPDTEHQCRWREALEAESRYESALASLRVGTKADIGSTYDDDDDGIPVADGTPVSLPTRVIPSVVVEPALATIGSLPGARVTTNELIGSPRWKAVTITRGRNSDDTRGGAALVWDDLRKEWRSFYDDHAIEMIGIDDEKLIVGAVTWACDHCFLEVDLNTYEGNRIVDRDRLATWLQH